MARLAIENLTRIFKGPKGESIPAVNDLSLVVEDREFLVLVGPSGCGKSTTLRLIAGLEEPTRGTISLDGRPLKGVEPKDRDLAMVFQNHALYPHLTAFENLAFGLRVRKVPRTEIAARVGDAAKMLGLEDCLERLPATLSGGQRQRVALGRALVRRPKILLFDEPLSNLDASLRAHMRVLIAKLHRNLAFTTIYVTHDQVEALTLGDRVAVMHNGAIQQVAPPMEVFHQPVNLFVAGFLGSPAMNFFPGTLARRENGIVFEAESRGDAPSLSMLTAAEAGDRLAGFCGKKIVLGLRPEHFTEALPSPGPPAGRTADAVVELSEPVGSETRLHSASGGHSFVACLREPRRLEPGRRITLAFDMARAHFFDPGTGRAINTSR